MSKIQPLADHVVAEILKVEEKTAAGIYLPDEAKNKPQTATVVAVGKDVKELKKGDTIIYKDVYDNDFVKHQNKEYLIIREKDVKGIVK